MMLRGHNIKRSYWCCTSSYQTCKDMGIHLVTALPILLSKNVFKENATMRSLIDNVNAKLRQLREWYQDPVSGFSFDNVQVRIPYPHDHGNIPPGAAPAAVLNPIHAFTQEATKGILLSTQLTSSMLSVSRSNSIITCYATPCCA